MRTNEREYVVTVELRVRVSARAPSLAAAAERIGNAGWIVEAAQSDGWRGVAGLVSREVISVDTL